MGAQLAPIWLHDDTEEDLVGADWHQEAIVRSVDGLQDHAEIEGLPWHVGNQLPLAARKPDGTRWRPAPDVMVHPAAGPEPREEMAVSVDGLPALVIEVVSKSTWRYDRDLVRGKAWGYLALGIPELLLFDPSGEFLDPPCQGWRLENGTPRPWRPDGEGRFHSALGVAFQAEGMRLRVLDGRMRPIPFRHERASAMANHERELERQRQVQQYELERQRQAQQQELERQRRIIAEREARISRLEAELAALQDNDEG
ncbi:MAG TPA: Uma2 family endonuclease [Chloroflexota bacterium]|nr:Uma2 family endonuclease [Chloroflexota bacterium]